MKRLLWNRHTRLLLKHAAGWFCLVAGAVMLVTPGQGLLTMLLGVYLLADEIPFFARLKARLQQRFPRATDYIHRKGGEIRARFHHR